VIGKTEHPHAQKSGPVPNTHHPITHFRGSAMIREEDKQEYKVLRTKAQELRSCL